MSMKIIAEVGYVVGHLRYGHFEATVPDDEVEEFNNMSEDEKKEYIREIGSLKIDDVEIDDWGDLGDVEVVKS